MRSQDTPKLRLIKRKRRGIQQLVELAGRLSNPRLLSEMQDLLDLVP